MQGLTKESLKALEFLWRSKSDFPERLLSGYNLCQQEARSKVLGRPVWPAGTGRECKVGGQVKAMQKLQGKGLRSV